MCQIHMSLKQIGQIINIHFIHFWNFSECRFDNFMIWYLYQTFGVVTSCVACIDSSAWSQVNYAKPHKYEMLMWPFQEVDTLKVLVESETC